MTSDPANCKDGPARQPAPTRPGRGLPPRDGEAAHAAGERSADVPQRSGRGEHFEKRRSEERNDPEVQPGARVGRAPVEQPHAPPRRHRPDGIDR